MEFVYLSLAVMMYFVPAIVAMGKQNKQAAKGVVALNFLLGWTVLGWIGALVWAISLANEPKKAIPENQKPAAKGLALAVVAMAAMTMGNTACNPDSVPVGEENQFISMAWGYDPANSQEQIERNELVIQLQKRLIDKQGEYIDLMMTCLNAATWTRSPCQTEYRLYPTQVD